MGNLSDSKTNDVLFGISGLSFGEETIADLATISKNLVQPRLKDAPSFEKTTLPTTLQKKAFSLLGVKT